MDHEAAHLLLGELAQGQLDADTADAVRSHAEGCGECGPLLRFCERLPEDLRAVAVVHPPADALAAFATDPSALPDDELAALRLHLSACNSCSSELDRARASLDAPLQSAGTPPPMRGRVAPGWAVAAILLLAVGAGYLLRGGHGPTPLAPAPLLEFGAISRGVDAPGYTLPAGADVVPASVPLDPFAAPGAGDDPRLRVELAAPGEEPAWSAELAASSVFAADSGRCLFLLPAQELPAGLVELRITMVETGDLLWAGRFSVSR